MMISLFGTPVDDDTSKNLPLITSQYKAPSHLDSFIGAVDTIWVKTGSLGVYLRSTNESVCCFDSTKEKTCIVDYLNSEQLSSNNDSNSEYSIERYDISMFYNGYLSEEGETIAAFISTREIDITGDGFYSAKALNPGSTVTRMDIKHNSNKIGDILFMPNSTEAIVNISKSRILENDVLQVVITEASDSIRDILITITGLSIRESNAI